MISRQRDANRAGRLIGVVRRLHGLQLVELDAALAEQSLQLATNQRLRGADAIYAAVVLQYATTLPSRDHEHLTRLVGIVPVISPAAVLAQIPGR